MFERYRIIHFVGIGGIGMSGIAEVLHNLDYEVTGSDVRESETTERLKGLGIEVHIGHRAENIDGAHAVVISSAVSEDNQEVVEAHSRNIPVIPRAEMLAELGRLKYSVLVAGSHGKTTTTSFVSTMMAYAGFDPTVVIGGKLKAFGTNSRLGRGEFMIAEADESDGSFLKLSPTIGVVTNIDREHMDYFITMDRLKAAFMDFVDKVPFYGVSVLCIDDPNVRELSKAVHRRAVTYGLSDDAKVRATGLEHTFMRSEFDVLVDDKSIGRFMIPAAGRHMVLNALACIAVGLELKVSPEKIKAALAGFEGIQRRMERKGEVDGVHVYDDYGHHPTEVKATLSAVHESLETGKLIVIFQPHRYSRTGDLMDEFAESFEHADELILMDIYAAGEAPKEGVSTEVLIAKMNRKAHHAPSASKAAKLARELANPGDVILTLGAGDVWKVGMEIIEGGRAGDE